MVLHVQVLSLLRKTESGSESESHDFQLIAAQKVDEIELIDSKKHGGLVTVKSADSVSSALSLLLNTGHKNLPVLAMDEKTQKEEMVNIIGLRSFRSSLSADDLQLSVAEYLAKINRKQPRDGLLYCSPNVTIKQLMQRFMETGLHQFWLSKDKYPVACVDLTDIIRCFVSVTDDTIASLRLAEKKEADRRARLINGQ